MESIHILAQLLKTTGYSIMLQMKSARGQGHNVNYLGKGISFNVRTEEKPCFWRFVSVIKCCLAAEHVAAFICCSLQMAAIRQTSLKIYPKKKDSHLHLQHSRFSCLELEAKVNARPSTHTPLQSVCLRGIKGVAPVDS